MEVANGTRPASWDAGGTVPVTLLQMSGDPATNLRYARVQASGAPGSVWFISYLTPVTGGKRVFVNAYLRSNLKDIRMGFAQYDQSLNRTQDLSGPAFTPSGWSFNNYLHRAGSWSATLRPDTRYIIVSVSGTVVSAPGYLDLDGVSVFQAP